ncbi:hypothetical protein [Burkholderia ambifaria]|uniref:hypothetical protein n=1 Tax=Burkholderia ambifaria TaxID=152480 RepID=UPI000F808262|nr:hypothetical protein [Burkholderia ambifaria]
MDWKEYEPYWNRVEPLMNAKLEALKQQLEGKTQYTVSEIFKGGDEEFRLSLDLRRGDDTVLGMDFILLDADANGAEEGVGIKLDLIGYGGLMLGGYAPYNYTDNAFTTDLDEVAVRVEQLDVGELATYILNDALTNETLLRELANAN